MSDLVSQTGGEVVAGKKGKFLLVKRSFSDIEETNLGKYIESSSEYLRLDSILESFGEFIDRPSRTRKDQMIFFDIETLGLGIDEPITTIAFGGFDRNGVGVEVAVARDMFEETPILEYFLDKARSARDNGCFFSYNGQNFDVPRLAARFINNGLSVNGYERFDDWINGAHIDLYQIVRYHIQELGLERVGKKLQRLEKAVFDYRRKGDLGGNRAPQAYEAYVNGYSTWRIKPRQSMSKFRKLHEAKKSEGRGYFDEDKEGAFFREFIEDDKAVRDMAGIVEHNAIDVFSLVAALGYLCSKGIDYRPKDK